MLPIFISSSRFEPENLQFVIHQSQGRLVPTINPYGRKLTEAEITNFLGRGYIGLIAGLEPLTEQVLTAANNLRVIARVGTGLDSVDLSAAQRLGITVLNTPDATTDAVAELTLAHMLNSLRSVACADRGIRAGRWMPVMGRLLKDKTVGIVGFGRIGRRVGELVTAFGARLIFTDTSPALRADPKWRTLQDVCLQSDLVTLHVPLEKSKQILLNREMIALMKPDAVLLNVARGGLVDEVAVYDAVKDGKLTAGIDCFAEEPYTGLLRELEGVTLTAHMGSRAIEARIAMEREAASALIKELQRLNIL